MSNGRRKIGSIRSMIEGEILKILDAASTTSEDHEIRPLREIMQNSDDAFAERLVISVNKEEIYFFNDGECLTDWVEKDSYGNEERFGTLTRIHQINTDFSAEDNKSVNSRVSGNFGTGLRSAHLFSDKIEIHARLYDPILNDNPTYIATASCMERKLVEPEEEEDEEVLIYDVRDSKNRTEKLTLLPNDFTKFGSVLFKLKFRRYDDLIETRRKNWGNRTWDNESITRLVKNYQNSIPEILLGCRRLREVVFHVNIPGHENSGIHTYSRDYDLDDEFLRASKLSGVYQNDCNLTVGFSNEDRSFQELIFQNLSVINKSTEDFKFRLYLYVEKENSDYAKKSHLEPNMGILSPLSEHKLSKHLPVYSPISLAASIEKRNNFAPIGYLPPHESRRFTKFTTEMNSEQQLWAITIFINMCDKILPEKFEFELNSMQDGQLDANLFLRGIPRQRPDIWFIEGENGVNRARVNSKWNDYVNTVVDSKIISHKNEFLKLQDCYTIDPNLPPDTIQQIKQIIDKLGFRLITEDEREIFQNLKPDSWWGENSPLMKCKSISQPNDVKQIFDSYNDTVKLDQLGKDLVKRMIKLFLTERPKIWREDQNCYYIPCIPDGDGNLRPFKNSNGKPTFYEKMELLPNLISKSNTIKPEFRKLVASLEFDSPNSDELAEIVDKFASNYSKEIDFDSELHEELSQALVLICNGLSNVTDVAEHSFIPVLEGKRITIRRPNFYKDKVWGQSDFPNTANYQAHYHRSFIFSDKPSDRKELGLGNLTFDKLNWLEISTKYEKERNKISQKLMLNGATGNVKGINIIRSLIFAEKTNGLGYTKPISLFTKHDNGEFELERWIGKRLDNFILNEELDSLLGILSDKDKLPTGWGFTKNDKELHLLRTEDGKWSNLEGLCIELPDDVAQLFDRKKLCEEHRLLLKESFLTKGLGVVKRIDEQVILTKLKTLEGTVPEVRKSILDMMLQSDEEWILSELSKLKWIVNTNGEIATPGNILLPSKEMVLSLGATHSNYLDTRLDLDSESVVRRAIEIGILTDPLNKITLLKGLMIPDTLLSFPSYSVLDSLEAEYKKDAAGIQIERRFRLPSVNGEWSDNSMLVPDNISSEAKIIFAGLNVKSHSDIGSETKVKMVKEWMLPKHDERLDILNIVERFRMACKQQQEDIDLIENYLSILDKLLENQKLVIDDVDDFLFPINSKLFKMAELWIVDNDYDLAPLSDGAEVLFVNEDHKYTDLLEELFSVPRIGRSITKESLERAKTNVIDSGYNNREISAYWMVLSEMKKYDDIVSQELWLVKTSMGLEFNSLAKKYARIPEPEDTIETIDRLVKSKIPLLWLPREDGAVKRGIYELLKQIPAHKEIRGKFLKENSKKKPNLESLSTNDWPVMQEAISNIWLGLMITKHTRVEHEFRVLSCTSKIQSEYILKTEGGKEIFYRNADDSRNFFLRNDHEEKNHHTIFINNQATDSNDIELVACLADIPTEKPPKDMIRKLIKNPEDQWENIDPKFEGHELTSFPRPLLESAYHHEHREKLKQMYDGCMVCGRQTPANKNGDFQESVVSLFKEKGGKYFSKSMPLKIGNVMYLCPNHKAIYSRSKKTNIFTIVEIDALIEQFEKDPSKKHAERLCRQMIDGNQDDITMKIDIYERLEKGGNPETKRWDVIWKKKHAQGLVDVLTQYLMSRVELE